MKNNAQALWYTAPQQAAIRPTEFETPEGTVTIRALYSAVSRGTERLVWSGRVPEAERARMRAPFQEGEFPFPVKYGYACVGRIESGPDALRGRLVFCLHPHQSVFALPVQSVTPLPPGACPRRACLAANMETALNAVWDSGATAGDRICVVGAGAVGLLTAALLSRLPGAEVFLVDVVERRADLASHLDVIFTTPERAPSGCDVSVHASASAGGLATAMAALGPEGVLVEMSWHGAGETPVALGGAFHSQRLTLRSSQVGALPPARRPRWDHARRLAKAVELVCADDRLDALLSEDIPFEDAPCALPTVFAPDWEGVAPILRYA
jgi:NADPH:quinone reductase-like Zn-dependent oxidoreductase